MIFTLISILLIIADQISKIAALKILKPLSSVVILKNIFSLSYVENRGAAFGMMQNSRWIFIVVTTVAILALIVYRFKFKPKGFIVNSALCMLLAGAVGNMIDRVFRGYVIDMLEVTFISYPVFNLADCFVVIGAILLCIYILFIYDDTKEKKQETEKPEGTEND